MVIGVIPNPSSMQTLLNNLKEADFSLRDVSVIMSDPKARNAIAKDAGPLKGVVPAQLRTKLVQAGVSQADAKAYGDALAEGKVVVAIRTAQGAEQPAIQMLQDYAPENVKIVG